MGTFGICPDDDGMKHDCIDPRPECEFGRSAVDAADELRAVLERSGVESREVSVLVYQSHGLTLAEAGRALGVSESRACQLRTRALNTIRWWHGLRRPDGRGDA